MREWKRKYTGMIYPVTCYVSVSSVRTHTPDDEERQAGKNPDVSSRMHGIGALRT